MVTWVKKERGQPNKGIQVSGYGNLGKRGSERNKEVSQTRGDKSVDMVTWVKEARGQPNKRRQVSGYGNMGKRGKRSTKQGETSQ